MKIVTVPNLALRQVSQEITRVDRHLKRLLTELQTTLTHSEIGVGLAAPQLGTNLRVFAINLPKNANDKTPVYHYYINPSITKHSQEKNLSDNHSDKMELEGCLSIPHIYAGVARYPWIEINYQRLEDGQLISYQEKLTDFSSRVFQHEFDHLDGILFTDHALQENTQLYQEIPGEEKLKKIDQSVLFDIFGQF